MKLLIDENLSPKLVVALSDLYPDSVHVDKVGLGNVTDRAVWEYAKLHGYVLVSKDSDFHEMSLLYGDPPKVVWIRHGNCSVKRIELILRNRVADIERLIASSELSFIILL